MEKSTVEGLVLSKPIVSASDLMKVQLIELRDIKLYKLPSRNHLRELESHSLKCPSKLPQERSPPAPDPRETQNPGPST